MGCEAPTEGARAFSQNSFAPPYIMPYEISSNKQITAINDKLDALSDLAPANPPFSFQRWTGLVHHPVFSYAQYNTLYRLFTIGSYDYNITFTNPSPNETAFTLSTDDPNATIDTQTGTVNDFDWYLNNLIIFDSVANTISVRLVAYDTTDAVGGFSNVSITEIPTNVDRYADFPRNWSTWNEMITEEGLSVSGFSFYDFN